MQVDLGKLEIRLYESSCPHESLPLLIIDQENNCDWIGKLTFEKIDRSVRLGKDGTTMRLSPEQAKKLRDDLIKRFDGSWNPIKNQLLDYGRFPQRVTCQECRKGNEVTLDIDECEALDKFWSEEENK